MTAPHLHRLREVEGLAVQLAALEARLDARLDVVEGHGVWADWTPVVGSNLTLGNGTIFGRYTRIGNLVVATGQWTLGSTSAVSGAASFTLPVDAADPYDENVHSDIGGLYDVSAGSGGRFPAIVRILSPSAMGLMTWRATAGDSAVNISSAYPFTWATGDIMFWNITYEGAAS